MTKIQVMSEQIINNDFAIIETQSTQSIQISYSNLSFTLKDKKNNNRKVLHNLSGTFTPGLNAILGGSGAGKTSLLNIISKKIESNKHVEVEGKIMANNVEYDCDQFQNFASFVMQEDILLPTLTVREYLEFAANLKLHGWSKAQKEEQVNRIIKLLMLQKCQNTLIGDQMNKGISGGERKRACIGVELIGNPKVLFLDEPTSGLDSFTAYQIMKTLKDYSQEGDQTIIFTIHQPSSDIWQLFDRITLLVEGKFIYQGYRAQILKYFSEQGYDCPVYSNPSDYLMCIMQSQNKQIQEKLWVSYDQEWNKVQRLNEQIKAEQLKKGEGAEDIDKNKQLYLQSLNTISVHQDCFYTAKILIKRQLTNIKRNRILLRARLIQAIVMNLFLGLIYLNSYDKQDTASDIIYICKVIYLQGLGMFFQSMNPQTITFSMERAVFLKEEGSKMYSATNYFLSKILPEIIVCTYFGIQLSIFTYWMVGFEVSASKFFFYALNYVLIGNIGNSIGILASSIFESPKVAVPFAITFVIPFVLFSGIYKNIKDLPTWIGWFRYLTPTFYSTNSIVISQFEGKILVYDPIVGLNYDFNKWIGVLMLFFLYIFLNLIAFIFLLSKRRKLQ